MVEIIILYIVHKNSRKIHTELPNIAYNVENYCTPARYSYIMRNVDSPENKFFKIRINVNCLL